MVCLVLVACGSPPTELSTDVDIEPDELTFCCDPEALPQVAGTVTATNRSDALPASIHQPGTEGVYLEPGETETFNVYVESCEQQEVILTLHHQDAPTERPIALREVCPSVVEDPEDPDMGDPALDIRTVETSTDDGIVTTDLEFHAPWPVPATVYSYFVRARFVTDTGAVIFECIVERHDGVDDVACQTGDVARLTVTPGTGLRLVYDTLGFPPASFVITGNVAATPTSAITTDTVEGPAGAP